MKILILVDSLKVGGGSDKVAAILGSQLHDEGYDVSFLTLSDDGPKYDFKGDYHTLDEKDIYGNNLKRFFKLLQYSPRVKSLCDKLNIDIVISAGDPANFHALSSRYFFGNKAKIVISQHMNPEIFLDSSIKRNLIKFFYPQADKTVCVSKEIERILKEEYGVQNTQTIYNMMDIEENIQRSQEELTTECMELMESRDETEHFNFISIGRLNRQKGQWFLIRSFRRVVDKHENARLFILGEGDLQEKLESLIHELNLDQNIYLLGGQDNIFPFLKMSDCFILPSLWEGLPMALIEALSLDLPIISADCKTGPREILCPELDLNKEISYPYMGKHAVLAQPFPHELLFKNIDEAPLIKSEEMLADLMMKVIENEDLRKKYSNGHLIAYNFDKENILTKWSKLLKEICG